MKLEFRTLDGAIAMREVAEPLPLVINIPCWLPIQKDFPTELTPVRTYGLVAGPMYSEIAADTVPPAHAAEIDRIALALESHYEDRKLLGFSRALADLLSLKKRYFAHTEGKEALEAERDSWKAKSEKIAVTLTNERAAHAETNRRLAEVETVASEAGKEKWAMIETLNNVQTLKRLLKEFLA